MPRGHALECRLYAEDPQNDDLPSPGRVLHLSEPEGPGIRVDSGLDAGSEVTVHYDPLLAKVITWGRDRPEAIERMRDALAAHGGPRRRHQPRPPAGDRRAPGVRGGGAAHRLHRGAPRRSSSRAPARRSRRSPPSPPSCAADPRRARSAPGGRRPVGDASGRGAWARSADAPALRRPGFDVEVQRRAGRDRGARGGPLVPLRRSSPWGRASSWSARAARARTLHLVRDGAVVHLSWGGVAYTLAEEREGARSARRHDKGALEAPMPGRVAAVRVAAGQRVAKGEELLVVEAMKMENALRAPGDGVVRAVHVSRRGRRGAGPAPGGDRVSLPRHVTVVEVGPRDGLQNEATPLSVEDRVAFCDRLVDAGLPVVEVGAFVSPKWVPQMAGSDEVLRRVAKPAGRAAPRARAQPHGLRAGARGGRARDRRVHGGERDVQPPEHERHDRRVLRPLRRLPARGEARGAARARLRVDLLRLPLRGRRRRRSGSWTSRGGWSTPAATRSRSGIPSGSRCRHRWRTSSGGCGARSRWIASPCTSTTRAARPSRTCSRRCRRA